MARAKKQRAGPKKEAPLTSIECAKAFTCVALDRRTVLVTVYMPGGMPCISEAVSVAKMREGLKLVTGVATKIERAMEAAKALG